MANVYHQFLRLLPQQPLLVGTVTEHKAGGVSVVQLPQGGQITVLGQSVAVGAKAFIEDGKVIGEAPDLTTYTLYV